MTMKSFSAALCVVLATSCTAVTKSDKSTVDLGLIPIGASPNDTTIFKWSGCADADFSDCTALDQEGRQYVFFDGALAKVSARRSNVAVSVALPGGIKFGDSIEYAKDIVEAKFGVRFDRAQIQESIVYTSDFSIHSTADVLFSMELIGGDDGKLVEVVQRTDF